MLCLSIQGAAEEQGPGVTDGKPEVGSSEAEGSASEASETAAGGGPTADAQLQTEPEAAFQDQSRGERTQGAAASDHAGAADNDEASAGLGDGGSNAAAHHDEL